MSTEANAATAKRFTDALIRRDYESAADELAPDFMVDDNDIPESTGSDSFYEWIRRWDDAWETWTLEDIEVTPAGDSRTLSTFTQVATGRGSGVELRRPDAVIADFRDGKITRLAYYNDQAAARADLEAG
jgi:ketosteroid isomerase-like protein